MYFNPYWHANLFKPSSISSIIMTTFIVAWFATIPSSVVVAWAPVIIAGPTFIIPRAVVVSPAPTPTIVMVMITRIAGIIRAWVIKALA
jgi:hypothetical protein